MKKQILFAGIICLSLMGTQSPARADHDDWHKKYDRNHDGRWDYAEFERAQREWERTHKGHPMTEKQLREYYARLDRDRDGYLSPEEAHRFHPW